MSPAFWELKIKNENADNKIDPPTFKKRRLQIFQNWGQLGHVIKICPTFKLGRLPPPNL